MNEQMFLGGRPVVGFGDTAPTTTSSSKRPLIGLVVGGVAGGLVGAFVQQPVGTILGTMVGGFGGLMVGVGLINAEDRA